MKEVVDPIKVKAALTRSDNGQALLESKQEDPAWRYFATNTLLIPNKRRIWQYKKAFT
jgi:hypothetical protein